MAEPRGNFRQGAIEPGPSVLPYLCRRPVSRIGRISGHVGRQRRISSTPAALKAAGFFEPCATLPRPCCPETPKRRSSGCSAIAGMSTVSTVVPFIAG